jgi:hypothetical protein
MMSGEQLFVDLAGEGSGGIIREAELFESIGGVLRAWQMRRGRRSTAVKQVISKDVDSLPQDIV